VRRNWLLAAYVVVIAAILAALGLGLGLGPLPSQGPTTPAGGDSGFIALLALASGNNSTSVHLVQGNLVTYPLLDFSLDALAQPGGYANVTRDGPWIVVDVTPSQREVVRSFIESRFQAEYGDVPFPHNDSLWEVHFCGATRSGPFCGYTLVDFQRSI